MQRETIIVSCRAVASALAAQLRHGFEIEFGSADRWAAPHYYALMYFDGELAGHLGILNTKVSVGDGILRVAGIGGVVTKPDLRRRGVASELLSSAAEFVKSDLRVEFGLLLCRHEVSPVYAKMGWTIVPGPTTFTRSGVAATYPNDTMILRLADKEWPRGPIDMLGLPW